MAAVHVHIEGRVQGVGFRYFTQEKAIALALTGWVRNLPDGSVEAWAQGPRGVIEEWLKALQKGPPLGRVTALHPQWDATEDPSTPAFQTFQIR
jgi:acylphosphatase